MYYAISYIYLSCFLIRWHIIFIGWHIFPIGWPFDGVVLTNMAPVHEACEVLIMSLQHFRHPSPGAKRIRAGGAGRGPSKKRKSSRPAGRPARPAWWAGPPSIFHGIFYKFYIVFYIFYIETYIL